MALYDINLSSSEDAGFILEIPADTVAAPIDIASMDDYGMVFEIPVVTGGGESFGGGFF
jgi:hypothetical protein